VRAEAVTDTALVEELRFPLLRYRIFSASLREGAAAQRGRIADAEECGIQVEE
jgi:hypothetical protein